jgi:hypothetical protein
VDQEKQDKEGKRHHTLCVSDDFRCLLGLWLRNALDEIVLIFVGELFESPALGLGQEQGGEDAGQHEKGEDLEDVLDKRVGAANVL